MRDADYASGYQTDLRGGWKLANTFQATHQELVDDLQELPSHDEGKRRSDAYRDLYRAGAGVVPEMGIDQHRHHWSSHSLKVEIGRVNPSGIDFHACSQIRKIINIGVLTRA